MSEILENKIGFYIPSTGKNGQDISDLELDQRTAVIANRFAELFGGSTTTEAFGNWIDNGGNLVNEKVKIVSSYMTKNQLDDHYAGILALAKRKVKAWYQTSIFLENVTDGKVFSESVENTQEKVLDGNGYHSIEKIK